MTRDNQRDTLDVLIRVTYQEAAAASREAIPQVWLDMLRDAPVAPAPKPLK